MGLQNLAPVERRSDLRRRMLKGGVIAFGGRHSTLPCVVRDISETGARLQVDQASAIPDTFELIIELDGLEADCTVVWRDAKRVGVDFLAGPRMVTPKRAQIVSSSSKPSLRRKPDLNSPANAVVPVAARATPSHPAPAGRSSKVTRAIPLLIAEDDADDRFLISDAFAETNFEHPVTFVENGEELLRYLRQQEPFEDRKAPGLILLDLNMPKMDGRTALMHIKTDPTLKRIPVIVFTTSNAEDDIERTYELGVSAYISKPGCMSEMTELVESLNNHWMRFVALPNCAL